jgi:hypothetical protein
MRSAAHFLEIFARFGVDPGIVIRTGCAARVGQNRRSAFRPSLAGCEKPDSHVERSALREGAGGAAGFAKFAETHRINIVNPVLSPTTVM